MHSRGGTRRRMSARRVVDAVPLRESAHGWQEPSLVHICPLGFHIDGRGITTLDNVQDVDENVHRLGRVAVR